MSEELKPCPFCKEQHDWTDDIYDDGYFNSGIICHKRILIMAEPDKKEVAEAFWNTRPIEDQLRAENERLMETINLLRNWVQAYPLSVFPEPDLKLARKLLTDGGVSYDALNAYSMRHVINGVGKIIDEALNEVTK